jgi:hypothetical protein
LPCHAKSRGEVIKNDRLLPDEDAKTEKVLSATEISANRDIPARVWHPSLE